MLSSDQESQWISDEEIIRRFESDLVPEASFHHPDHVRLAFAYLREYPVLPALEKFSSALKRFATVRGKTQLYNGKPSPAPISS
jgi:hypothetical protein